MRPTWIRVSGSSYTNFVFEGKNKAGIHLGLKHVHFLHGAGVRLAYDGDDVDLLVDLLHHLHVQGLQSVAGGRYEVETGVDPLVSDIKPGEERLSELLTLLSSHLSTLVSASR